MPERDSSGRFLSSGNPSGRPRGAANKLTVELREMIRQALEEEGGVDYLRWAARNQPTAFLGLVGRLIPAEVKASLQSDETVVIVKDYTGMSRLEAEASSAVIDVGSKVPEVPIRISYKTAMGRCPPGPPSREGPSGAVGPSRMPLYAAVCMRTAGPSARGSDQPISPRSPIMHFTEPPPFLWNSETSACRMVTPWLATWSARRGEMPLGMTRKGWSLCSKAKELAA